MILCFWESEINKMLTKKKKKKKNYDKKFIFVAVREYQASLAFHSLTGFVAFTSAKV